MKSDRENKLQRFSAGSAFSERYEFVRHVGSGSVGEVYQVLDKELENQAVAIKFLHHYLSKDKSTLQRFQNEVFVSRQLSHPNIVRVYDFAEDEGVFYLTLEYVSGCDLSEVADSYLGGRLPVTDALYLLRQIAEGLAFAHAQGVVHRDVKPQNIIVDKSGLVKISDFGVAHSMESSMGLTSTGELIGSPAYLAPEQFVKSESDPRTDVYAFGILAYELLCGELPFASTSYYELATQHREQPFPIEKLRRHCKNEQLCEIIASCCDKEAVARPEDGTKLVERLQGTEDAETGENVLKTIVSQRRKDSFIQSSQIEAQTMRFLLLSFLLAVLVSTFMNSNSRRQVAEDLALIELHTGVSTRYVRSAILYGSTEITDIEVLRELADADIKTARTYPVEVFLKSGVNLKTRLDDGSKNTILHYLAESYSPKINVILTEAKLQHAINEKNVLGETPLIRALRSGQNTFLLQLLRDRIRLQNYGSHDIQIAPFNERTIFSASNDSAAVKFVGSIVPGADITIPDKAGNYPVHIAAAKGDAMALEYLLEATQDTPRLSESFQDGRGHTALHICVLDNNVDTLAYLLSQNFNVDVRDRDGRTPLMLALAQKPTTDVTEVVFTLVKAGASTEARDNAGLTARDHAMQNNRLGILKEAML